MPRKTTARGSQNLTMRCIMEECCDIGEDGCEWAADYTGSRERMRLSCLVRCLRLPPNGMRATKEEAPPWRGMLLVCVVFLVIFVFVLRGGFADFFHDDGIGFVANGCRFQRVDFFQAQAVHPVVAEVETVVDEVFFLQLRVDIHNHFILATALLLCFYS